MLNARSMLKDLCSPEACMLLLLLTKLCSSSRHRGPDGHRRHHVNSVVPAVCSCLPEAGATGGSWLEQRAASSPAEQVPAVLPIPAADRGVSA